MKVNLYTSTFKLANLCFYNNIFCELIMFNNKIEKFADRFVSSSINDFSFNLGQSCYIFLLKKSLLDYATKL